jgi:predicted transcriptional regulator
MHETGQITNAEWELMKIIWANTFSTSKLIIDQLKTTKGWSPSTVKTLLQRLVLKNVINYKSEDRTFFYFPLITEETCIKKEFQLLLDKVYCRTLNKESSHFLFYGTNYEDYIGILATALEANYDRIIADLCYQLSEKIIVHIHPNKQSLHSALGVLSGPDWLRAGWTWGILHIVSLEYFTDISATHVAVHALAEIVIQKINPSAPYWLHQGLAAYEGQWLDKSWVREVISSKVKNDELPNFQLLLSDYRAFGEPGIHLYPFVVVEFIAKEFGLDKLNRLLRAPTNWLGIFNMTEEMLFQKLVYYLKNNY